MIDLLTNQPGITALNFHNDFPAPKLRDKLDSTNEMTDAQWLRYNRKQSDMTQSNIVSYLEITTWQNVNSGRVAEIETGQRCIPPLWRERLERLFSQLQKPLSERKNWRELI